MKSYTQLPIYSVNRLVLQQDDFEEQSGYQRREDTNCKCVRYMAKSTESKNFFFCSTDLNTVKQSYTKFNFIHFLLNIIPVLKWLPKYSIKSDLPGDISAGITVAVMHIPQGKIQYLKKNWNKYQCHILLGMAYGLLAGVTPSSGLYMAIFPTLIYFAFGTSRHISVGTLSVISLMTLKLVQTYAHNNDPVSISSNETFNMDTTTPILVSNDYYFTPIQVVTAAAFMCGVHQILMSFLRLGSLASLLSEPLVNGFTTGAAVHVTVSQLKDLFGIQIPRHKGAFKIIYVSANKRVIN